MGQSLAIGTEGIVRVGHGTVTVGDAEPMNGFMRIGPGGELHGHGTIFTLSSPDFTGGVNNFAGDVFIGFSPGILTIEGDYTQGADGRIFFEIGGTIVGEQNVKLVVTGDATIEGTVVLEFVDGFAPKAGQDFGTLLDITGAADVNAASFIVQNLAGGFEFDITPMDSGFMLTALTDGTFQQAIPGDYDNSGQVEQADLDLVLLNWGESATPIPDGWVNDLPNGHVDQAELDQVLLNWGDVAPQPEATNGAVPEPATWAMLLTVGPLCGFFFSRRVRRHVGGVDSCRRVRRTT